MPKKSRRHNNNKYQMSPHQIDRALQLRLEQGLSGGDLLVLSRQYMQRRVRRCAIEQSPYPILRYHGWRPGMTSFDASHLWKEEADMLKTFGIEVDILDGFGWKENREPASA